MATRQPQEHTSVDVEALMEALNDAVRTAVESDELEDLPRRVDELLEEALFGATREDAEAVMNEVRLAVRSAVDQESLDDVESLLNRVRTSVGGVLSRSTRAAGSVGSSVRDRIRSMVDGVRGSGRESVVMLRINPESRERLEQLVDGGLVGSRSEAAAFLLAEGIRANEDLFAGIATQVEAIQKAKEELQRLLNEKS